MGLKAKRDPTTETIKLKTRARRERGAERLERDRRAPMPRNDLLPEVPKVLRRVAELKLPPRRIRKSDKLQLQRVMASIQAFGFVVPILVHADGTILDGATRWEAALALKLAEIPCLVIDHLTDAELRLLRLALNRLAETGVWDLPELSVELQELGTLDLPPLEVSGFATAEIDALTLIADDDPVDGKDDVPDAEPEAVSRTGDIWRLGEHRIACGDARDPTLYERLLDGEKAQLLLTDEPFNVPIAGHVTSGKHREFALASGEMTETEFEAFNGAWMQAAVVHLVNGALLGTFIDWRSLHLVLAAARSLGLDLFNLIVWSKSNAGMGSLWRSQHELLPVFKVGEAPHVNNVELGRHGRWRSNVWNYPGASSLGSDARDGLKGHPTPKPVQLLEDALLDVTNRGDIVLEPFSGSGSTLVACESTRRRCRAIELDALYVDLTVRRWEAITSQAAIHEASGLSFAEVADDRCPELLEDGDAEAA